jgi:uncharacterized protein
MYSLHAFGTVLISFVFGHKLESDRMTTVVTAIFAGIAVLLAGSLPWLGFPPIPGLAWLNLHVVTVVPWAVVPMTIYLWVYWRYIDGRIGSPDSAAERRANLRANRLSPDVWAMTLMTGLIGFGAIVALLAIMARLLTMPASAQIALPEGMPSSTGFLLLVMSSVVAGVTEEAGFRGYMQGPIERQYGLAAAILINGVMFGLLHFPNFVNQPSSVFMMLPYYVAVSAVYGGMTWAANSILPSLTLHATGNVFSLTRQWTTGRSEWEISANAPALIWDTGVDPAFAVSVIACVALGSLTAWLYSGVHRMRVAQAERDAVITTAISRD